MAAGIGVMSALIAYGLMRLIGLISNLSFYHKLSSALVSPAHHHLGPWVILVPVMGGLLIGIMARFGSEKIRGHGIPEALEAILVGRSRMEAKVAVLKPLSSAISIGTGGPFGAEGPIIMTGGAFGSLFAQLFHLSAAERKSLLVAGAAGGMSAIFSTPVSALLLAVELLLFEWKPRSFIPVGIASAVAGAMRVLFLGPGPIFPIPPHDAPGAGGLAIAFATGLVAGLGSSLLTALVYGFEDLFQRLPIHWMWWPLIGGLFVGIGGWIDPRVLGVGYDTIHSLLRGQILGSALIGLVIGKALVWSIALGSGTSGGVLAPLLMMGGAIGAIEARWIPIGDPGLWALVGMAAMMGGTMRSPLTAIVFALELTHDLNVLPALLLGCIASHAVTVLLMRRSILTEKIARRGLHITREYSTDPLDLLRVGDVMDRIFPAISFHTKLADLSDAIGRQDPRLTRHHGIIIVDDNGAAAGIITRGDIVRALGSDRGGGMGVLEAGSRNLIVAYPDELVSEAAARMLRNDLGRLPVVSRADPKRVIGYIGRSSLLSARLRRLEEEHVRESGWIARMTRRGDE